MTDVAAPPPTRVGPLLRDWRRRRRMSQLDLALQAGVSARHVSFVETGRARPSAEMVQRLAEQLDVPLRDRNALLLAAGYAPAYARRGLDEPEMGPVREVIDALLRGHELLSFLSTMTTFDTAADVTVAELAIESFFPADRITSEVIDGRG